MNYQPARFMKLTGFIMGYADFLIDDEMLPDSSDSPELKLCAKLCGEDYSE